MLGSPYKKFAATAVLKLVSVLAVFLVATALARLLGTDGYGTYSYVYVIISLLSIATNFGAPRLAMRETARALKSGDWPRMRQVWRWSTGLVGCMSAAIIGLAVLTIWALSDQIGQVYVYTFFAGLALVPLLALGALRGSFLRGLGYVVIGQLPEFTLRPVLFLILITVASVLGQTLTPPSAMVLYTVAAAGSFLVGYLLLRRRIPEGLKNTDHIVGRQPGWLKATFAMGLTSAMVQINTYADILILGLFQPIAEVGIYRIGTQVALLSSLGLQAATIVTAPLFATSLLSEAVTRTQKIATLAAAFAFAIALPSFIIFLVFGNDLLTFAFGVEYVAAYSITALLMMGQLVSSFFGPTPQLHVMSGREKFVARIMIYATIANVTLNFVFIPRLGMIGAGLSTVVTMIGWNIALWWTAWTQIGVKCGPLPPARIGQIQDR
ncbi:oligosaccharide flippase family protein [Planktotalea sp.]|uniref:oligosaccharide flippase family protein n=1 Tax=Planktotalea sp. TaxID=2029877 RepID=UPI0035C7E71C